MTTTVDPVVGRERPQIHPLSLAASSGAVVRRNLIHIKRMPELLLDVTIQPVMFVLLFAFVFGGSIAVEGSSYREFLVPGIMVQTIVFSAFIVAIGLTNDLDKGIVDRLKSLPISRASILVGRSISSLIHSSIGIAVMALTGLLIGWRVRNGFVEGAFAFGLILLFGFGMIWVGIWVGSLFSSVEAVHGLHVHRDVPADVRGEHLRAAGGHAERAAHGRRVEPGLVARTGVPGALGQRSGCRAGRRTSAAAPRAVHDRLVAADHSRVRAASVGRVPTSVPRLTTGFCASFGSHLVHRAGRRREPRRDRPAGCPPGAASTEPSPR